MRKYVPDGWGPDFVEDVTPGSRLERLLLDLMMAWRTTAYIASTPSTFIKAIRASTLAYARFTSPDSSIVAFGEKVLAEVSAKVAELTEDRQLRSRLMAELIISADSHRSRAAAAAAEVDMPIQALWEDFLKQDAFSMTLWASQRAAYVAFYNAYETFLVLCAKQAIHVDQLRATDAQFMQALRSAFASDLSGPCWGTLEIQIARESRHALSHAGGRVTDKLKKLGHGMKTLEDVLRNEVLQIFPDDNRNMLSALKRAVDAFVAVAAHHPRLTVPAT